MTTARAGPATAAPVPPGPANAAAGPANVPSGPANVPSGPADVPPGPANAAPGPADVPPGPADVPPGARADRPPGGRHRQRNRVTMRRVLACARPYRREMLGFLAAAVVSALVGVLIPALVGSVIDTIAGHRGDRSSVVRAALGIAGLAVADGAAGLTQRWCSARVGEGVALDLRTRLYDHIQRMPVQFFARTRTGALLTRLDNDVAEVEQAFTATLSGAVGNLIALVFTGTVMFTLSWPITLLALVLLPTFILPARRAGRRLSGITRERLQVEAAMNSTLAERFGVAGALLVRLFASPEVEARRFGDQARRVRDLGVTSATYARLYLAALTLTAALAQALVYGLGGALAMSGTVRAGTVTMLALLLARVYGPLTSLSNVRVGLTTARVSFDRVFELLDLRPAIAERPGAVPVPPGMGRIELRDVHFRYPAGAEVSVASLEDVPALDRTPGRPVLRGVSFTVEPGRVVAIVGPSGAGKSTLAMLVPRLYDATHGCVLVNGVDVRAATLASLRAEIGVVTQDAHLFHESIAANLRYARPHAHDDELWAALDAAQAADVVRSLPDGLDTVVGERGYRLSGGEKQRIAIARVLLKRPSIVILDEATAHLDAESEAAVQRALTRALAGRTALVIAHRLSTVRNADEILVLDQGRIVERGPHDVLVAAGGPYANLYRTQFAETPVNGATVTVHRLAAERA